ncbi:MAG: hypothetical protein IPG43_20430 [Proteobacteria bacterium]|nr:hypothetical protein [Pseudomonadota bacterium]
MEDIYRRSMPEVVLVMCPGWVKTQLADDVIKFLAKRDGISEEEAYHRSTRHIPMRRVSQPTDCRGMCISFLQRCGHGHRPRDGGGRRRAAVDVATIELDV